MYKSRGALLLAAFILPNGQPLIVNIPYEPDF